MRSIRLQKRSPPKLFIKFWGILISIVYHWQFFNNNTYIIVMFFHNRFIKSHGFLVFIFLSTREKNTSTLIFKFQCMSASYQLEYLIDFCRVLLFMKFLILHVEPKVLYLHE